MTQAQLNSMAKRINTALVQYKKTFGANSDAYKNYEQKIINAFGAEGTHITTSGHVAINLGKGLARKEESLMELDRPYNKVKGQLQAAKSLLKYEMKKKDNNIDISKVKIPKKKIMAKVEKISTIQNFFDEIGVFYAFENEYPEISKMLDNLRGTRGKGNKITYEELFETINELEKIYDSFGLGNKQNEVSDEEIEEITSAGTKMG